jgi:predicted transcriptional regulator
VLLPFSNAGVPERSKGQGLGVLKGLDKKKKILDLLEKKAMKGRDITYALDLSASTV